MDNRISASQGSPFAALAKPTAVAVLSANWKINQAGTIDLAVDPQTALCKNERFVDHPSLQYSCTGFLVAPDLLATAGHCVYAVNTPNQERRHETKDGCENFAWLFDYNPNAAGKTQVSGIPQDRMYRCKEIIYAVHKESKMPFTDYALIRLDRPVKGRTPFKINTGALTTSMSLSAVGYPFGTPAKVSNSGRVRLNNAARASFITTLDVFEGNSGGPVLNMANEVVGILVGGTPMYNTYEDKAARCERVNRCSEDGSACKRADTAEDLDYLRKHGLQAIGSEVMRIQPIVDLMREAQAGR